jgi:hypothetical protein
VEVTREGNMLVATLTDTSLQSEEHNFGLLILDADTRIPVGLNYTFRTSHSPESGTVRTVTLDLADLEDVPQTLVVYLMVDAYPAAVNTLD